MDTIVPKKFKAKKSLATVPQEQILPTFHPFPITLEEEVTAAVIEWYTSRGLPVPPEELAACKGIDAQQMAEYNEILATVEATPPKPVYGTPEFWKDWWAKKRAKEAALKEAGLPIPPPKSRKKKMSNAESSN